MRDFTAVPNALVRGEIRHPDGRRISVGAQALYALILDYSRGGESTCIASQATLARQLDVTVRWLRTWVRELEQLGLVKCERGGRNGTNRAMPLLVPERQSGSGREGKPTTDKEDAQGEEDNGSTKGDAVVLPLRRELAS
jgi:transposase-like protein